MWNTCIHCVCTGSFKPNPKKGMRWCPKSIPRNIVIVQGRRWVKRWHPGTQALWEIRHYQRTIELCIRKGSLFVVNKDVKDCKNTCIVVICTNVEDVEDCKNTCIVVICTNVKDVEDCKNTCIVVICTNVKDVKDSKILVFNPGWSSTSVSESGGICTRRRLILKSWLRQKRKGVLFPGGQWEQLMHCMKHWRTTSSPFWRMQTSLPYTPSVLLCSQEISSWLEGSGEIKTGTY